MRNFFISILTIQLATATATASEPFYKLAPKVTGWGVPISFSIDPIYFTGLKREAHASGRTWSNFIRTERLYYRSDDIKAARFGLFISQRVPGKNDRYGLKHVLKNLNVGLKGSRIISPDHFPIPTNIGQINGKIVTFFPDGKPDSIKIRRACFIFHSNDIHKRLYVRGYYCSAHDNLPSSEVVWCSLDTLKMEKFGIAGKLSHMCDGKERQAPPEFVNPKPSGRGFKILNRS